MRRTITAFCALLCSSIVLATDACNLDIEHSLEDNPYHYTNPFTACDPNLRFPGLPRLIRTTGFFNGSPIDQICRSIVHEVQDTIDDAYNDIVDSLPGGLNLGDNLLDTYCANNPERCRCLRDPMACARGFDNNGNGGGTGTGTGTGTSNGRGEDLPDAVCQQRPWLCNPNDGRPGGNNNGGTTTGGTNPCAENPALCERPQRPPKPPVDDCINNPKKCTPPTGKKRDLTPRPTSIDNKKKNNDKSNNNTNPWAKRYGG